MTPRCELHFWVPVNDIKMRTSFLGTCKWYQDANWQSQTFQTVEVFQRKRFGIDRFLVVHHGPVDLLGMGGNHYPIQYLYYSRGGRSHDGRDGLFWGRNQISETVQLEIKRRELTNDPQLIGFHFWIENALISLCHPSLRSHGTIARRSPPSQSLYLSIIQLVRRQLEAKKRFSKIYQALDQFSSQTHHIFVHEEGRVGCSKRMTLALCGCGCKWIWILKPNEYSADIRTL